MELPSNLSIVWHRGSKSFCEILTNQVMPNGDIANAHQRLWYEAPEYRGQLPNCVYGFAFLTALKCAIEHPEQLVHYIRQDEERIVPENANNAPFRNTLEGWGKFKK